MKTLASKEYNMKELIGLNMVCQLSCVVPRNLIICGDRQYLLWYMLPDITLVGLQDTALYTTTSTITLVMLPLIELLERQHIYLRI